LQDHEPRWLFGRTNLMGLLDFTTLVKSN